MNAWEGGKKMYLPLALLGRDRFADSRAPEESRWHAADRSRGTYLLEASIHDSDLLAGEFGLSQKFLYRHRPGGLLPRPRALEVEERLFRSRRFRRRCHDLWSYRRLNSPKSTTRLPPSPFQFPSVLFISDDPRGHTIASTFPVIVVRLAVRFLYRSAAARLARLRPDFDEFLASIEPEGAKFSFGVLQNISHVIPTVVISTVRMKCAMRDARDSTRAGSNIKR